MRIIKEIKPNKNNENKKKLRVAAYARVSLDTEMLKHSLSNQISYYNHYIQSNKDWIFAGIYADEGISGGSMKKRTKFNELLDECRKGNIDLILTKSVSRFARNTVDLLNVVRELKEKGIGIRFEKERIDTLSANGELMLSILAGFAQQEAESIGTNLKWAFRKRAEMGIDQRRELFGYDYKDGKYYINKKEAKIIKQMFKMFLEGHGYTEIGNYVNSLHVTTRKGNKWGQENTKKIIKQEKYAGYTILQKTYITSSITHHRKINYGEHKKYKIDNTHPAIISIDTFNKAQARVKEMTEKINKSRKRSNKPDGKESSNSNRT